MKVKTRLKKGELMYFFYGNEIRSANINTVIAKDDGNGLQVFYGFNVTLLENIWAPGSFLGDDWPTPVLKLKLMVDADCFSDINELCQAHIKRYEQRLVDGADVPIPEEKEEKREEGGGEEAVFTL